MNKIVCPYCKDGYMHDVGLYPIMKCSNEKCGKVQVDYTGRLFDKQPVEAHHTDS
jgi:hypothetical protein